MITSAFVLKLDLSTQINIRSNLTDVEVSAKVSGVAESRYLSYWQFSVDEPIATDVTRAVNTPSLYGLPAATKHHSKSTVGARSETVDIAKNLLLWRMVICESLQLKTSESS